MMSGPSVATIKRLFAVSGNLCAFPGCSQQLVDDSSGKVTGRICHIQGTKGPRYNPEQSATDRDSYDNLLLLCPSHHDVVDADVRAYTVDRLQEMKRDHEGKSRESLNLSDSSAASLIQYITIDSDTGLTNIAQSGGQFAQNITNVIHGEGGGHNSKSGLNALRSEAIAEIWQFALAALNATLDATVNLAPLRDKSDRQAFDVLAGAPFPDLAEGEALNGWASTQNDYLHVMQFPHFGHAASSAIEDLGHSAARARLVVPQDVSVAVGNITSRMRNAVSMAREAKTSIDSWRAVMATVRQIEHDLIAFEDSLKSQIVIVS